eukprot:scaffold90040_cov31-Tisochrysis_lutea.AAC.3
MLAPPKKTLHDTINPDAIGGARSVHSIPLGQVPGEHQGKRCNRSHKYEKAWADGVCLVPCAFPKTDTMPLAKRPKGGVCVLDLGPGCLYLHKCAATRSAPHTPSAKRHEEVAAVVLFPQRE